MNRVTLLSREIVSEIQTLTNRSITVEDYLKIRESASKEIECGLYASNELMETYSCEPVNKSQETVVKPVTKTQSVAREQKNNQLHIVKGPVQEEAKLVAEKKMPWEVDDTASNNTASDDDLDFFAMCDAQGE